MKERIIEFLKAENKSSAQFADEIGVQPSGISHILSGRNKPSLDFVVKMLTKYGFLSTEWLLFGKGNMYRETEMQRISDESLDFSGTLDKNQQLFENKEHTEKEIINNRLIKETRKDLFVEKIVCFYSDKSFKEYFPG